MGNAGLGERRQQTADRRRLGIALYRGQAVNNKLGLAVTTDLMGSIGGTSFFIWRGVGFSVVGVGASGGSFVAFGWRSVFVPEVDVEI